MKKSITLSILLLLTSVACAKKANYINVASSIEVKSQKATGCALFASLPAVGGIAYSPVSNTIASVSPVEIAEKAGISRVSSVEEQSLYLGLVTCVTVAGSK